VVTIHRIESWRVGELYRERKADSVEPRPADHAVWEVTNIGPHPKYPTCGPVVHLQSLRFPQVKAWMPPGIATKMFEPISPDNPKARPA